MNTDDTRTLLPTPAQSRDTSGHAPAKPDATPAVGRSSKTLSGASVLSSVTRELAHYIGPIAKVVVNRAAKQACTLDELYTLVCG